jgi:hypothetical protein
VTEYRLTLEGLSEHERSLLQLELLLRDLRSLWPRVVPLAISWLSRQFESEGAFFLGHQWAPLSPEYLRRKTLRFGSKPILSAEGDLRRAATSPKRTVTPTSLTLTIEPYTKSSTGATVDPAFFQEGTSRMPPRPLLSEELPHEAEAELEAVAERYVEEQVRRLGL